jgi:site-specific DNA-cytosine methylase
MKVLSLFDGISCGQVALKELGIQYTRYFASEIDSNAMLVTEDNFPNTIFIGDILNINALDYKDVDLILAGSPCQSFSIAGDGSGFDGKSGLFFKFVNILNDIRRANPKVKFLFENVRMKPEWRDKITSHLGVNPISINSKDFSAQKRPRLYWTNIANKQTIIDNVQFDDIDFKDILLDGWLAFSNKANCLTVKGDKGLTEKGFKAFCKKMEDNFVYKDKADFDKISGYKSIFLQDSGLFVRRLVRQEFERLQCLPDLYTKAASEPTARKLISNGWTVSVVKQILKHL